MVRGWPRGMRVGNLAANCSTGGSKTRTSILGRKDTAGAAAVLGVAASLWHAENLPWRRQDRCGRRTRAVSDQAVGCDAIVVVAQELIDDEDQEPADAHYARRREMSTLIGLSCPEMWENCFCTSIGGAPDDPTQRHGLVVYTMGSFERDREFFARCAAPGRCERPTPSQLRSAGHYV